MSSNLKAIPDGSTVLIVGASSLVGAHIVNAFLNYGYKVRATEYDLSQASWLTEDAFKSHAAAGSLELVIVPDITAENAFTEVMKGVSAVVYVACVTIKFNPNETIPQNIAGTVNALRAASKESSVSRFVLTSSYGAAFTPNPDPNVRLDSTSWNQLAIEQAWAPPPYEASRYQIMYKASKAQQEQAVWEFVEKEKPPFAVNTILPSFVTGKVFSKQQNPSSTLCVQGLLNGDTTYLRGLQVCKCSMLTSTRRMVSWLTGNSSLQTATSVSATWHCCMWLPLSTPK
jgi:nucleoside-diphosphate-sugar epimerase